MKLTVQQQLKSLEIAVDNKRPIYCMNNSKPKGPISINVESATGKNSLVVLPYTWIPVNLAEHASHEALGQSLDLKRFIRSQLVRFVEKEDAENVLSTPDAEKEYVRLTSTGTNQAEIEQMDLGGEKDLLDQIEQTASKSEGKSVDERVMEILERPEGTGAKLSALKAIQNELSSIDFEYVLTNCTIELIGKWARNQLAAMS